MKTGPEVIVIKKQRARHNEHHGGGWKVAFADFALAMMAFFLVLWLIAATNSDEKSQIAKYINTASILDDAELLSNTRRRDSLIEMEGSLGTLDGKGDNIMNQGTVGDLIFASPRSRRKPAESRRELNSIALAVSSRLNSINANRSVDVVVQKHGLRIIISDDSDEHMFLIGSAELNPKYRKILTELAPILNETQNDLFISGHTDDIAFTQNLTTRSNWELSSERAISARQALVKGGMDVNNMLLIAGMGAKVHRNTSNPSSGENRRVELYLLTPATAEMIRSLYTENSTAPDKESQNMLAQNDFLNMEGLVQMDEVDASN